MEQKTIKKYDKLFEKGKSILFLRYFLPFFPDGELSYLAGFSSIKSKIFIPLMALGHIGGSLGLVYIGSGLSYSDPLFIIWPILTLIAVFLFLRYYKKLK